MRFRDRADAGRRLAALLLAYRGQGVRVFGLGGSGVRVGYEVARALGALLDVWVARQVKAPGRPEVVVGAVSEEGACFLKAEDVRRFGIAEVELAQEEAAEATEVEREAEHLRGGRLRYDARGSLALLVVDGVATGSSRVHAALRGLRQQQPRRLVLGTPVASTQELEWLRAEADEVVCVHPVPSLLRVEHAYDDFRPLSDIEVRQLLERAREPAPRSVLEATDAGGMWM